MASTPGNTSNSRGFDFARYFLGPPQDEQGSSGSDSNLQNNSNSSDEHNAIIAVLQGRRQPHQHQHHRHHHNADDSSDCFDDEEDGLYSSLPNLFSGNNNSGDHIRNSSSHSNLFPTRSNDLRHVDQRVNYMDAEAAVYDEPSDSEYYSDSEQQEECLAYYSQQRFRPPRSGSMGRIQQGLQALRTGRVPRAGSLGSLQLTPPARAPAVKQQAVKKQQEELKKSHSMSFLSDFSDRDDRRKSILEIDTGVAAHDPVKRKPIMGVIGSLVWKVQWKRISLMVFLVLVASLLAWTCRDHGMYYMMKHGDALEVNTSPPAIPNASSIPVPTTLLPSTDQGNIARRKLVLEHVIEHDLLPLHPGHESDLLLTSPAARKAMTWMIGHDVTSMELLDQYHFYHHNAPEMIQLNKQYTTNRDEIVQKNKILDRYVMAAAYFKEHPNADVRVVVLN